MDFPKKGLPSRGAHDDQLRAQREDGGRDQGEQVNGRLAALVADVGEVGGQPLPSVAVVVRVGP